MATYHKYECKILALLIGKNTNGFNISIMHTILITDVVSADIVITNNTVLASLCLNSNGFKLPLILTIFDLKISDHNIFHKDILQK